MRKSIAAIAVLAVLAAGAVAYAQEAGNSYTVQGGMSPTKSGTTKKPVPLSLKFAYQVEGPNGQRPSPVEKYEIFFSGSRVNTNVAPACASADEGPDGCPAKSIVGTGYIKNATGATNNPNDRSVSCNAKLWVINKGKNKGVIFVRGNPTASDPREKCDIQLSAPIQASWKNSSKGSTLTFTVPSSLLHPLPTLSNAVTSVESSIKKISKRINGVQRGFYEGVKCTGGKRTVEVTFTPEQGTSKKAKDDQKCS